MRSTFLFLILATLGSLAYPGRLNAQTASFNFTLYPVSVSGWVNVSGNPAASVLSGTDPATGITVTSISTANWAPYTNGLSAYDSGGISGGTFFPAAVMLDHWFQYNPSSADFNAAIPQLKVSGLNKDSIYTLRMTGSFGTAFDLDPTQYTVIGARQAGSIDVNNNNNTAHGAIFDNIYPDPTGSIYVYVNTVSSTQIADICGIQIIKGTAGTFPSVSITQPQANAGLPEDNTVTLAATATEAGGAIAQVQFFVDATLIGTLTAPPYQVSWAGADPGTHTIIASAVDTNGNSNSASISVLVQSTNFYWSTTGNIGNNGDSDFVGNVDSVRLGLRTKDIERMTISPTGNIGIGMISPAAQLHTTGSVRLAGLINDSTSVYPRVLVSDTSGDLAYRTAADIGQTVGGGLGMTGTDSLSLGDSVAGSGAHNFTANRYQNLNGYYYSIGGKVNNPVTRPDLRWYNNGDFVSGTTMDHSVATVDTTGIRYYNKLGVLQVGASDWLDTMRSPIITAGWQGSGLHVNSANANTGGPKMINTLYLGQGSNMDTSVVLQNSLLVENGIAMTHPGSLNNSLFVGGFTAIDAPINNSVIVGNQSIQAMVNASFISENGIQEDTTEYSTITGWENVFGGLGQLVAGSFVKNPTPFGAAFGLNNVGFTNPYTETAGMRTSGISGYPLLALGNAATLTDTQSTNAITVLFNGRTQINTTGFGVGLTPTSATPKAALEVVSTNTGVLFPLLTAGQVSAIASGDLQTGLLLYNSSTGYYQFYNGSGWQQVGFTGDPANVWQSLGNSGTSPATNFIGTADAEPLVFRANDTARMTILPNGSVGIGTSAPQTGSLLAINGTVYAKKIEATSTGWPDYVFEPGYALITLPKLQRYIRLHRRLPGTVSARAAVEKGVDLEDDQAALLRKIEEMTLYLIEAKKQSDVRHQEIDRLKEQNKALADHQQEIDELKAQLQKLMEKQ